MAGRRCLAGTLQYPIRPRHIDTNNVPVHDWVADGPADIGDLAAIFAHSRPAALEWYWPRRLSLDLTAIDPLADSPVTQALGLRVTHAADINIPLDVFATGITHGTVISSDQWVVANSKKFLQESGANPRDTPDMRSGGDY
jgi:hypothetical protein